MALTFAKKILSLFQPADAPLQGRNTGLKEAIEVLKTVKNEITRLRSEEEYRLLLKEASNLLHSSELSDQIQPKRQVKSVQMKDFVICGIQPSRSNSRKELSPFKAEFFETIDMVTEELNRRFSDNEELIDAIANIDNLILVN